MSLPTSPNETYSAGNTPTIKAQTLNDLQTWLAWLYNRAAPFAFGDGSDGVVTFDGTSTVLGIVPSGGAYRLNRDIFCTNLTITGASTVLNPWGYRIYCTGTLTTAAGGIIYMSGGNIAAGNNGTLVSATAGGGVGGTGSGGAGGATLYTFSSAAGAGGAGSSGGGAAGTQFAFTAAMGSPRIYNPSTFGSVFGSGITPWNNDQGYWTPITGGAGGGAGGGDGTNSGAGGGAGGGVIAIAARFVSLANATDIQAKGGAGLSASAGNCGGGGGGAGGTILLAYVTLNQTLTAAQNCTGGAGGAGHGTGVAGSVGGNGAYFGIPLV